MSYNRDNFIRVRKEFEEKAAKDREEADSRRAEIHEKLPEVRGIDAELMRISTDMVGAGRAKREGNGRSPEGAGGFAQVGPRRDTCPERIPKRLHVGTL